MSIGTNANDIPLCGMLGDLAFQDKRDALKFNQEVPSGTVNGTNVLFTLAKEPSSSVIVFQNGIIQRLTTDFSVSGKVITFVSAPVAGSDIYVIYLGA